MKRTVVRERPSGGDANGGSDAGSWGGGGEQRQERWRQRAARAGERMAEEFLALRGYEILDRNVRSGRGEVDLIAREQDSIVFVEVKLRTGADSAAPLVAVNAKKREDLGRAAARWLQGRGLTDRPVRFDVIGITWEADGSRLRVEHIRNAFPGGGRHFF